MSSCWLHLQTAAAEPPLHAHWQLRNAALRRRPRYKLLGLRLQPAAVGLPLPALDGPLSAML